MSNFKPAATRITSQQQVAMYRARKKNRMARALASPTDDDVNRERLPIDTDIDMNIDNPSD